MFRHLAKILLTTLFSIGSYAQYDKVWIFGSSYTNRGGAVLAGLDFNRTPPVPFAFPFERVGNVNIFGETTASISDDEGKLLFATDGYHIWTREGKLMPNGRGVNFKSIDTTIGNYVGSASQGSLIVKIPCEENLYYVFAVGQAELGASGYGDLHYSMVDMQLNNGMGDVIPDKKSILLNRQYTECMTVVQGKGNYLWLLVLKRSGTERGLHAYKITIRGIEQLPVVSYIGNAVTQIGWMVGNNKADKVAIADYYGSNVRILDFDNETGKINNIKVISNISLLNAYGACFSPNDSLLYVTSSMLLQFEVYNNFVSHTIQGIRFSSIQKGSDDKLYFVSGGSGLASIENPNKVGADCGVNLNAISFDRQIVSIHGGLPNTIGVFKSNKKSSSVAYHIVEDFACSSSLFIRSTDTIPDKTTFWSTGEWGDSISVNQSGVYVAHTMSNSFCIEHIDSYFVTIPNPLIEFEIEAACPTVDNGKAHIYIRNVDAQHVKDIIWYNATRNQILGYGDTIVNLSEGKYWVKVNYTSCDTMIEVNVPRLTDRVSFYVDSLVCVSTTLQIANESSDAYTSFQWQRNGFELDTQRSFTLDLQDTGQLIITLIGKMEHCYDTLHKSIQIDPRVATSFKVNPKEICVGEKINIQPSNHYTTESYAWQIGKHQFVNHSSIYSIAMDEPGEYPIKLTTTFRICPDTVYQVYINVHATPEVFLGNDSSLCYQSQSITLQNLINQPTNTYSYRWSTGDTTRTLKVTKSGSYWLTQRSEPIGCTGYGTIEINKDCFVDIPNAFTPNDDGVNDYFFPRRWLSNGVVKFHLQIFNRWGQMLYETNQVDGLGWDGKWNGQLQPMGVYIYRISVAFENGIQEIYEGNVTLVR